MRSALHAILPLIAAGLMQPFAAWASTGDVLFHAPFQEGLAPVTHQGEGAYQAVGEPRLVEGREGRKALGITTTKSGVEYSLPGNLSPSSGTIAFWFSAVDWDGADNDILQMLFSTEGPDARIQVQHTWHRMQLNMIFSRRGENVIAFPPGIVRAGRLELAPKGIIAGIERMESGKWYHAAFVWHEGRLRTFRNGEPRSDVAAPGLNFSEEDLALLGQRFAIGHARFPFNYINDIGTEAYWKHLLDKEFTTLLDDFVIFNRPLHPVEITRLYELGVEGFVAADTEKPSELLVEPLPTLGRIEFGGMLGPRREEVARLEAVLVHTDQSGEEIITPLDTDGQTITGSVSTAHLRPGAYEASLRAYDHKGELISRTHEPVSFLLAAREEWWGNTLGMDDVVLPPHQPIEQEGTHRFSVWARTVDFGDGPLPRQFTARGEDLLAEPAKLTLSVDGREVDLGAGHVTYTRISPTQVHRVWNGFRDGINLRVTSEFEYDGFTWFNVEVFNGGEKDVDGLVLELAVRRELAPFIHSPSRSSQNFPPNSSLRTDQPFVTGYEIGVSDYIWLGDYERGLQWATEGRRNWHNLERSDEISVLPDGDVVRLRIKMVDAPHRHRDFAVGFSLHPTPVRPPVPRSERLGEVGISSCPWPAAGYAARPAEGSEMTEGEYWASMRKRLQTNAAQEFWRRIGDGLDPARPREFLYSYIGSMANFYKRPHYPEQPLEYLHYGREWRTRPERGQVNPLFSDMSTSPASAYADWWVWSIANRIVSPDYADWKGIYFDHGHTARECTSEFHGSGYIDEEGVRQPEHLIRAGRRLLKRISAVVKGVDAEHPQGLHPHYPVVQHMSGTLHMSYLSFVDFVYDGENMAYARNRLRGRYFSDVLTHDFMAAEWHHNPWGYNERGTHNRFDYPLNGAPFEIPKVKGNPGSGAPNNPNVWQRYLAGVGRGEYPKTEEYDAIIAYLIKQERDVNAMFLQYDRTPHRFTAEAGYPAEVEKLVGIQNEFGFYEDDVEFIGFWRNQDWIEGQTAHLKVAVYRRLAAGEVLLVLSNNSDEPFKGKLTLDLDGVLPGGSLKIRDAESDEHLADGAGGVLSVNWTVARRDYRLIRMSRIPAL